MKYVWDRLPEHKKHAKLNFSPELSQGSRQVLYLLLFPRCFQCLLEAFPTSK